MPFMVRTIWDSFERRCVIEPRSTHLVCRLFSLGFDEAYLEYNQTFSEYLTVTAGQRFDPPIGFEMVPVNIQGLFDSVQEESIDFIYSNPG